MDKSRGRTLDVCRQLPASAEVYLRHGIPPIVIDVEDYVQWDYDRFTRLQVRSASPTDLPRSLPCARQLSPEL